MNITIGTVEPEDNVGGGPLVTSRMLRIAVLTAVAATAFPGAGRAQSAAAGPRDLADWAGCYAIARGTDLDGLRPPPTIVALGQMAIEHLQRWALAKIEASDFVAEDAGQICLPNRCVQVLAGHRPVSVPAQPRQRVQLALGDVLFFYTDGCVEAENAAGEMFGTERLEQGLQRAIGADDLLLEIDAQVTRFRAGVELSDDATMMVVKIG